MVKPDLKKEKQLWKKGYNFVGGIDEVGRGCVAGPVVAGIVVINKKIKLALLKDIKDSKQLSPEKREEIYKRFKNHQFVQWAIGRVSEKTIDKINILEATKLAMEKAVKNLEKKYQQPDFLILDGNIKLAIPIAQEAIIKGDQKIISCSLASIMAKVSRDRLMKRYHIVYPAYGFDQHKGYLTESHARAIQKQGLSRIHRKTFQIA